MNEKIFDHEKDLTRYDSNARISREYLIDHFGTFPVRSDYECAFVEAGPFVAGDKSILSGRAHIPGKNQDFRIFSITDRNPGRTTVTVFQTRS